MILTLTAASDNLACSLSPQRIVLMTMAQPDPRSAAALAAHLLDVDNPHQSTPESIGAAAEQSGHIQGQYDIKTSYTPVDTDTVTHDYQAGNALTIDASLLTTGEAITLAISNWPAGEEVFPALTVIILAGADPLFTMYWPAGITPPDLVASKFNVFTLFKLDAGSYTHLISGGDFNVSP